jgi:gliding motility-associated-like protein
MMKYFYLKVIFTGLVSFLTVTTKAQLAATPIHIETIVHQGDYGEAGMDLSGYVTYKVYVQFTNSDYYLTSIFATEYSPDCTQDADSTLFFNFPCGLFQHPQGSTFGYDNTCLTTTYPTVAYDSYLTIGKTCQSQSTCDVFYRQNRCNPWQAAFDGPANANYFDGASFFWDEGNLFNTVCSSTYPNSVGRADANGRVFIGQFTTCGNMNGCINLTYRHKDNVAANNLQYTTVYNVCFSGDHPCLTNTMDNTATLTPSGCSGDPVVTLDGGGNGNIDYFLYDSNDVLIHTYDNQSAGLSISGLTNGDYYIVMEDALGCEDQTAMFTIVQVSDRVPNIVITPPTCNGLCNGTLVYTITGGIQPYTISVANASGGPIPNLTQMCSGMYIVSIEDGNGCVEYDNIEVGQPDQISGTVTVTPESCVGSCDGRIELSGVTGGSGTGYVYTLTPNAGSCVAPCSGNNVTFESLCAGNYAITVVDDQSCQRNFTGISMSSPNPLTIVLTPTAVSCNGGNDGSVLVSHTGGTGVVTVTPGNFTTPGTATGLSAGTHTFTIEDAGGCTATADVVITEPAALQVTIVSTTDTKCFGNCNGIVQYQIVGGISPYTYTLNPQNITGPANAAGAISSLCAGNYSLVVKDLNQCLSTVPFTINQPAELSVTPIVDMPTCTGMTDGSVELLISGGTGQFEFYVTPQGLDVTQVNPSTYSISNLGEIVLSFELIDENQCVVLDTLEIFPLIISDMVLSTFSSPETCWNEGDGTATIGVQGGHLPISYLWDDPNSQTTATATGLASNFDYTVIVTDAIGCTFKDTVHVEPTVGCFFITNAITPNGDGYNDVWVLGGLEYFPDCVVNIYNVWGQNVFSSNGYLTPWNGLFKGELLPVADYYYVIEYDNTKDPIIGTVTLKY